MSFSIQAPETFNFNNQEQWPNWSGISCHLNYQKRIKKNEINTLKYLLGDKADDILWSLQLNDEQFSNYDIVKTRFDKYVSVNQSINQSRFYFSVRYTADNHIKMHTRG